MSQDIDDRLRQLEQEIVHSQNRPGVSPSLQRSVRGLSFKRFMNRLVALAILAGIMLFLFHNVRVHIVGIWFIPWWVPLLFVLILVLVLDYLWNRG